MKPHCLTKNKKGTSQINCNGIKGKIANVTPGEDNMLPTCTCMGQGEEN
jgi:hypothetical protein